MGTEEIILALVVATALAFDFTNGFHDTANAMATSIATRAMSPRAAVGLSAILNFAGAFISLQVAATVAEDVVDGAVISETIVLAGLLGGIFWNLVTWRYGLPSSSSHALIGGIVGAALVAKGADAVKGDGVLGQVLIPALIAPLLAGTIAAIATFLVYRLSRRGPPDGVKRGFRYGQLASASLVSLAHGTNDAQKTMGVITLALVAYGSLPADNPQVPTWVIISAATAIALGTFVGGWRIIRTLGTQITEIEAPQGFAAESAGASVILAATQAGFPLSTTHVVSGSVMGSGVGRRAADVSWGLAGRIGTAWIVTLPAAALIAAVFYTVTDAIGRGALGPALVVIVAAAGAAVLYVSTQRGERVTHADV